MILRELDARPNASKRFQKLGDDKLLKIILKKSRELLNEKSFDRCLFQKSFFYNILYKKLSKHIKISKQQMISLHSFSTEALHIKFFNQNLKQTLDNPCTFNMIIMDRKILDL